MTRTITNPGFSPKRVGETVILGFDFAALTSAPLAPVVTATRHAGEADDNPSAILSGGPTVVGSKVLQKVTAGVAGTRYALTAQIDCADGSRYLLSGVLQVTP